MDSATLEYARAIVTERPTPNSLKDTPDPRTGELTSYRLEWAGNQSGLTLYLHSGHRRLSLGPKRRLWVALRDIHLLTPGMYASEPIGNDGDFCIEFDHRVSGRFEGLKEALSAALKARESISA